jgi:hypothetical protein
MVSAGRLVQAVPQIVKRAHKAFLARHDAMVDASLAEAGKEGVRHASGSGKGYKTGSGRLERGNEYKIMRTRGGHLLRLRNRVPYAAPIDKGSRPHPIIARRAPLLRFYSQKLGHWVSKKRVNHPGNRPYKFLRNGMAQARRHFRTDIKREAAQLARRF